LLPSVVWCIRDQSVWAWDPSWYGEVATGLWWQLINLRLNSWFIDMLNAFGTKAPGVSWLGQFFVPIGKAIGSIEAGLLLSLVMTQFFTLLLVFDTARRLTNGSVAAGIIASGMTASAPLFVALSQNFFAEPLQLMAVAYTFWIAACSREMRLYDMLAHAVLAVSIGMIAKASYPLYALMPGAMIIFRLFSAIKHRKIERKISMLLSIVAATALLAMAAWYVKNFNTVIDFIKLASSSEVALDYGTKADILTKFLFWMNALKYSFSAHWTGILIAIATLSGLIIHLKNWIKNRKSNFSFQSVYAGLCFVQVLIVLFIFSININEETRYLLPLFPALALFLTIIIISERDRMILYLTAAAIIVQFVIVNLYALNLISYHNGMSYHLKPMVCDPLKKEEVARVISFTSNIENANRYSINGLELPWLNANTLSFFAQKFMLDTGYRGYYTSLGYAASDPDVAWKRLQALQALYFITLEPDRHPQPPIFLNKIAMKIQKRVEDSSQFEKGAFDSKFGILIYRRIKA